MKEATRKALLKLVADNFRSLALAESSTNKQIIWPLADEVSKKAQDKELKILELGCGAGQLAMSLPTKVDYLGLDSCQELITQAKARYANQPRRRFAVANLLKLNELAEIGFDYVIAINVLHHIPSTKLRLEALKQLKNKVKPSGKIYLQLADFWQEKTERRRIWKFAALKLIGKHSMDWGDILIDSHDAQGKLIGQIYYHAWSKKELKQLALQAGFRLESLESEDGKLKAILSR